MGASTVVTGKTRRGKSTLCHHLLENCQQEIVIDQQTGSTAWTRWKRAIETGKPAVFEDLDDPTLILPLPILPVSTVYRATEHLWRRSTWKEHLLETLIRRRGAASADANPLIEQTISYWCDLVYGQPTAVEISEALRVFHNKAIRQKYIDECSDIDAAAWWSDLPGGQAGHSLLGAADRILQPLRMPTVAHRLSREDHLIPLIDQGLSYFFQGGDRVTNTELRSVAATRLKQVTKYLEEGGQANPMILIEESQGGGMVGPQEQRVVQMIHKRMTSDNSGFIFVCQEPYWFDDEVTTTIMQNTDKVYMCCSSPDVASKAADDLLGSTFDPYIIKQINERNVMLGDDEFIETRLDYYRHEELKALLVKYLMDLRVGEAFVKIDGQVRFITVPPFETSVTDEQAEQARKEQSWLIRPETLNSEESTNSTQSQSASSSRSPSTPVTRLERDA